jgi:hypothetical protein
MAIEKSLSQAPLGLGALPMMEEGPELEIEIEDPESVEIGIDGMPVMRIEEEEPSDEDFDANLAEYMSDGDLQSLASDLVGDFDEDIGSRKDWMQTYVDGIQLLGMKIEERSEPWEGACGVYHPLLSSKDTARW